MNIHMRINARASQVNRAKAKGYVYSVSLFELTLKLKSDKIYIY